ncbi:hypothetical protein BGX34_004491 [Mortierella sp. NVP85]|nr:hypothetical protein BGX34_004491 [Mortierella sp. NVP85]
MSLTHSNKHPEAAHIIKGEILISDRHHPGYIQYCITLDQEWMTRRVVLTAKFDGSQDKQLTLEVDRDQRWYKVTEPRLARARSFFRSGVDTSSKATTGASPSPLSSNDADTSFSDTASSCSSSSSASDLEGSIPFEKINLTWTPPPKGSKRGSKRFSFVNPLKDALPSSSPTTPSPLSPSTTSACSPPCATLPLSSTNTLPTIETGRTPNHPTAFPSPCSEALSPRMLRSPVIEFAKSLSNKSSSSSLNGSSGAKTYEHLPALDGCIHLDLGDVSPTTLSLPLRRATLGIDPEEMRDHLATLMSCPSAVTSEMTAKVSFPDLELRPVRTHVGYVGQGRRATLNLVEFWTDEDDDDSESTLVEVDEDGLVTQYGDAWARLPIC